MDTSLWQRTAALAVIVPLSIVGTLSAPMALAQQQDTEFSQLQQRCNNAEPGSQLRKDCAMAEGVCSLGKMINSPRSYAECVEQALKYDAWSEERGSSSGESASQQTCEHSTDFEAVIRACSTVLNSGTESILDHVSDLSQRGFAYNHTNQSEKAEADYTGAIELGPRIPLTEGTLEQRNSIIGMAYSGRCVAQIGRQRWKAIVNDCTQAITLKAPGPFLQSAYSLRGLAYTEIAQSSPKDLYSPQSFQYLNQALADFNEAIALDPNDATALDLRGTIKIFFGRMRHAPDQVASGEADQARAKAINPNVEGDHP